MSFASIFSGIFHKIETAVQVGLGVATTVEAAVGPFVAILGPGPAAIESVIVNATAAAEMLITNAQSGAAKKLTVTQIVESELPTVQTLIASFGSGFVIPQAELSAAIDTSVAAKNALAALYNKLKAEAAAKGIVPVPQPVVVPAVP